MTAMRKIGDVLAIIFHPVFFAFYGYLLLIAFIDFAFVPGLVVILMGTVIIPITFVYALTKDIYLTDEKKRALPLFITALSYLISLLLLTRYYWVVYFKAIAGEKLILPLQKLSAELGLSTPELMSNALLVLEYSKFLLSMTVGLAALAIISRWYKISIHACGFGLLMFYFFRGLMRAITIPYATLSAYAVFAVTFILFLVITFLVLRQRLSSKSHSIDQVIAGFLLGLGVGFLVSNTSLSGLFF
jgi:hypothetical protein